ncbi:MAG: hypothetical protein Tsb0034_16520 [Ekhidna sp.]
MTKSAKTIWLFGIYLIIEGLFLMLAPSWVLETIGLPEADSIWRTILGFVVALLGYYYVQNARSNLVAFFGFTVQVRVAQFVFFIWLYLFDQGTIALVGFSFIEFMAGMWTWQTLKKQSSIN